MINKVIEFLKKDHVRSILPIVGVLLVILSSIFLLWQGSANTNQSIPTTPAKVYFEGEYRIGDGEWQQIVKGEHISSTKGDVTLSGNLYKRYEGENLGIYNSEDMPVAFYTNHINLTFIEIDETGRKVLVDGKQITLTPKEFDILVYMVKNQNIVLSREKILSTIWGYEFFGDDRTVDTHIKMLRNSIAP